jgi:hypothetical protein
MKIKLERRLTLNKSSGNSLATNLLRAIQYHDSHTTAKQDTFFIVCCVSLKKL